MAAVFGIDASAIDEQASPGSIEQWDSLRHMNLVLALEEEFGVRFSEEQIEQMLGFQLVRATLRELGAGQA
jgi:acyl carrier protein